jgi:hypothetical protein
MISIARYCLVFLVLGVNSAFAEALSVSKILDKPFRYLYANACTKTYPGRFLWYANLDTAATSLSMDAQARVSELVKLQITNPSAVTQADEEEFKSLINPLLLNVRLSRGAQIVARCRVSPSLMTTASAEGADRATPVIRVGSSTTTNCRFAKRDLRKLSARDQLTVRQGDNILISGRLRGCSNGCGIINCE